MPFNPNNNAAAAPSFADSSDDLSISPQYFEYAIVRDASGTDLLADGEVYPIAYRVKKGFKMANGGRQVELRFDAPVVYLLGVKNRKGRPAMPYPWDERRFEIVAFGDLTEEQAEEAVGRF